MFPEYIQRPSQDRQLFLLERGNLYAEGSGKAFHCDGYEDVIRTLWDKDGMAFVETLADPHWFPYLGDAVHSCGSSVLCSKSGSATGIRDTSGGRGCRWIVSTKSWHQPATLEFLTALRKFFKFMGFGTATTPSALGLGIMRASFEGLSAHNTLNSDQSKFISDRMFGGRVDTPGIGGFYAEAVMYDMSSAFLSQWGNMPTGGVCHFKGGRVNGFADWYAEVTVVVHDVLPLGPFPIRRGGKRGRVVYPTERGTYHTTLWKGQVEDCINAGCSVFIEQGLGWRKITNDTLVWAKYMYSKRINARLEGSEFNEDGTKLCTVGAIGRHATDGVFYHLVDEDDAVRGDLPLPIRGNASDWFVQPEIEWNSSANIHWYSHCQSETARRLYEFALPFAREGRLVASNYDSVIVLVGNERYQYAKKFSAEHITCQPGTWTWVMLHNLTVKRARTFYSDEYTVTPGVKRGND